MKVTHWGLMLLPVAVLSACGGDDNKKTPLEKLGIACATVETVVDENIDTDKNLKLALTGTFVSDSPFDSGAAEIVSYDTCSDQLFLTNASSTLDVLRLSDSDSTPAKTAEISLAEAGLDASVTVGIANNGLFITEACADVDDGDGPGRVNAVVTAGLALVGTDDVAAIG